MKKIIKNLHTIDVFTLLICVGLIVIQVWLDLELPKLMMQISSMLTTKLTTINMILDKGFYMLACSLGSVCSSVCVGFLVSRLSTGFAMRLRYNIFSTIQSFSVQEIKRFSTASLITRSTNDVMNIQQVISAGLQSLIKAPIMAIWAICEMSATNWQFSIITAIALSILMTTIIIVVFISLPKFKKMQTLTDNLNKVSQENLQCSRVVRAFNAEDYEKQKFEVANHKLTKNSLFASRAMSFLNPMMGFVMSSVSLAIYWVGSIILSRTPLAERSDAFGEIMGFSSYASQVIMAFIMLTIIFIVLPRAIVSIKRVSEVLNTKTTIVDGTFNGETSTKGVVEFKNVYFKYPDAEEYILEDISFSCNSGDTVAFIGSTGSGKSTLINLIPRFYDVTEGDIIIDGVNIKDYKLSNLRNKIGYVSQKAVIFSGSISDNITFGSTSENIKQDNIDNSLTIACAENFVNNLPNKKDSFVSQGGTNISGGQKQRLSIARAVAKNTDILIFDDSFSALDYKTDKKLRDNLKNKLPKTTKLIVAQRIGTIKDANLIVVLNEGKVVGQGTHKDLLNNCQVYREIALSQFSKEEIENETK